MISILFRLKLYDCTESGIIFQEVEREIVQVLVSKDQVDRIFERMYLAGRLDTPGMGYIYAAPLVQAATYIPAHLLEDKDSLSSLGV